MNKIVTVHEPRQSVIIPDEVNQPRISWASIGSVSIEEAEQFAHELADAIKEAKMLELQEEAEQMTGPASDLFKNRNDLV